MNTVQKQSDGLEKNRKWLREQMNPYFFVSMRDEEGALSILERELGTLIQNRRLILADRDKSLILALVNRPGTLYETLRGVREREISYTMIAHSSDRLPGLEQSLEIQRFEFQRKHNEEILSGITEPVPTPIRRRISLALRKSYPGFHRADLDRLLRLLWLNNPSYVTISPPERVAQILNLFQKGNLNGGLYLGVEEMDKGNESRVLFAVANPPQKEFLLQVMEVFNRLGLGVNRAYCLTISNGVHPYFLGTFYVYRRDGGKLLHGGADFSRLQQELYNTQILSTRSATYRDFVVTSLINGDDATLINAFTAFCHANLAHNQPDRFGLEHVQTAFHAYPQIALQLTALFRLRFDPARAANQAPYLELLANTEKEVMDFNTGHRYLDEIRRIVYGCTLAFIRHTLKTNFFVLEKQALAFRLDPAYLTELGPSFTSDLPAARPFRITFFYSRHGAGFHIGFSDIARGGWRTVIARTDDDYATWASTLFRENFVLAHTQHLKNKDIYEGGSKLVVILDSADLKGKRPDEETMRLFKLQYGITNAFLDIFVTKGGKVLHPQVVDYYGQDEPIELGPDENMQDGMIEAIARMSDRRRYLLGIGIMSSKRVGINHKEYGVTSTGVITFAEITMAEIGIDVQRDPFSVKLTGGTNGDVAGNGMKILLDRCPAVRIVLILDGTAALHDPAGADPVELRRILLKEDLHAFDPTRLNPGGFMIFRSGSRTEGLRELFRKVTHTATGVQEEWISIDEFSREYGELPFTVKADLFIPAGGRPETIDSNNWENFFLPDGTPTAKVIVEGANSFITPEARVSLQREGVIIMRDASANKCGVISSSYEIIANLLMTENEFLSEKERYVADVLAILEKRAGDEATLILKRHREHPELLCTDISDSISTEINARYARLFAYFEERPGLTLQPLFRRAILSHLPQLLREQPRFRRRLSRLPPKYLSAILAAEIGSSMVYRGDTSTEFEDALKLHLIRNF